MANMNERAAAVDYLIKRQTTDMWNIATKDGGREKVDAVGEQLWQILDGADLTGSQVLALCGVITGRCVASISSGNEGERALFLEIVRELSSAISETAGKQMAADAGREAAAKAKQKTGSVNSHAKAEQKSKT